MRICQFIPTLLYGGAEAIAVELHKGFLRAGHQSLIIANSADYIAPRFRAELMAHGELQLLRTDPYSLVGMHRFLTLARECRIDAVISHLTPTLMAALCNRYLGQGIPWMYVEHNPMSFLAPSARTWVRRKISRFLYPAVDRIAVVSPHIQQLYFEQFFPQFTSKVRVIPNGIDVEGLKLKVTSVNKAEVRTSLGIPPDAPVIGIIGRLVPVKGHIPFIRELLKQWASFGPEFPYLLLVGGGVLMDTIRAEAQNTPLETRLIMTGAIPDISEVLSVIDIGVISSFSEGLPVNLLETGAVGTPVVAMSVGGVPYVLSDNPDWTCTPGNYPELVSKLRHALSIKDTEIAQHSRSRFAEKIAKNFDIDNMVQLYLKELEQIKRSPSPA